MRRTTPKAPPLRRGPAVLLADGLILLLALYGAVFSFVSAFSLPVDGNALLILCPIYAGLFLAVFSLPRFRWLALLALGFLYAWGLWRAWDQLALGEIAVRCAVVNTFVDSLGVGQEIRPIAQLPPAVWTAAATRLVRAAMGPMAGVMALSVVRLRSFWLLFWDSFPFAALPLAILVTPDRLPLLALLCCWCAMLLASLAGKANPAGGVRITLAALPACAALLLLLSAALPEQTYRRPAWADAANQELTNWFVRMGDDLFPASGPGNGPLSSADGDVDLSQMGPLRYSGRTVLRVDTDLRGRIYLRGFSGGVYEDNAWRGLDESCYRMLEVPDGDRREPLEGALPLDFQPMNFPALAARASFPERAFAAVTVENLGAAPGYVYYPYQLLTTPEQLNGAEFCYDAWLGRASNVRRHTLYVMPGCDPLDEALSLTGTAVDAQRRYAAFAERWYTQVPEELRPALDACAGDILVRPGDSLPGGQANPHYSALLHYQIDGGSPAVNKRIYTLEVAGLITDYLNMLAVYNPDTPVTPEGEDFTAYFLTDSREGYCMHFASAATLLLRYFGIPARYVSGYVADVPASGQVSVPDSNAHAWVEVYLEGYGWEPVEVTPVYAGSRPGQSGAAAATPTPSASPVTPSAAPTVRPSAAPTPAPTATPQPDGADGVSFDARWLGIPAGILLLLAALCLRRRWIQARRARRCSAAQGNRGAIESYLYLQRLVPWGGAVPPEAEALAKKAKFSQHRLTGEELAWMEAAARAEAQRVDQALPLGRRLIFRYLLCLN